MGAHEKEREGKIESQRMNLVKLFHQCENNYFKKLNGLKMMKKYFGKGEEERD